MSDLDQLLVVALIFAIFFLVMTAWSNATLRERLRQRDERGDAARRDCVRRVLAAISPYVNIDEDFKP